ncbi:MAG: hypothetical protein GC184_09325 [Rhizobiales bacterium]|nr:hypothetical protein [Hyphomicrobiales bacterium]
MPMTDSQKADQIAELRRQMTVFGMAADSGQNGKDKAQTVDLGLPRMGVMLPALACGALHEVQAADYRDMSASIGFAMALAVCCGRRFSSAPILWCESARPPFDMGHLYGPGLAAFGLDPARLILVAPASAVDLLWTMEEALRLGAFAAVFGEIDGRLPALSLTATRRLQLAAEAGGRPAFLLTGHATGGTSAAATRWDVAAAPSSVDSGASALVGRARWRLRLKKCRNALAGAGADMIDRDICVEWDARRQKLCDVPTPVAAHAQIRRQAV